MAGIVERLLGFLEMGKDHVTAETLIQIKDLLRRYPDVAEAALAAVAAISPTDVAEPEAKAAFIWILGHHGAHIQVNPLHLFPLYKRQTVLDTAIQLGSIEQSWLLHSCRGLPLLSGHQDLADISDGDPFMAQHKCGSMPASWKSESYP